MPYLPNGATPAQLDAFSLRLSQQLTSPCSRKSLMAVREAFARSGGYPDAHAMEEAARKDSFWSNPLIALSARTLNMRQVDSVMGIRPAKLAQWATQTWKKHQVLLKSSHTFDPDQSRQLLANLWSHTSWDVALEAARDACSAARIREPRAGGLVFGSTREALETIRTGHSGNFSGIHRVLGCGNDHQWIGLDWAGALTHVRVMDEERRRRYRLASQWIRERALQGDEIFLVDASEDGSVSQEAMATAALMGVTPCVVDMTQGMYMENLHQMSAGGLTTWMLALLDYETEQSGVLISWIAAVALRWKAGHRFGEPTDVDSLFEGLNEPGLKERWWRQDVGLSGQNVVTPQQLRDRYEQLPTDWLKRVASVRQAIGRCIVTTSDDKGRLFGSFTIFRLPFLLGADTKKARQWVAMATLPWRDQAAQGLGQPLLESSYEDIFNEKPHPLERRPVVCCHVDIPANCYGRGEAVMGAQSRALGISNLRVGPRIAWAEGERFEEVRSIRANTCTDIFMDPTQEDDYPQVEVQEGQAIVVHRNQSHAFWPGL